MSDTGFGLLLLGLSLEKKLGHFADGQTLGQVVKRPVFIAAMVAAAVFLAAKREALDKGRAEEVGIDFELRQEQVFALAQGQGGLATQVIYPRHI